MSKIHVLYVGDDDWTTKYSIPDNIEFEVYESDESELTANRPARKLMDLVILDRDITLSEEKKFTKFTRGYCLFCDGKCADAKQRDEQIFQGTNGTVSVYRRCAVFSVS